MLEYFGFYDYASAARPREDESPDGTPDAPVEGTSARPRPTESVEPATVARECSGSHLVS